MGFIVYAFQALFSGVFVYTVGNRCFEFSLKLVANPYNAWAICEYIYIYTHTHTHIYIYSQITRAIYIYGQVMVSKKNSLLNLVSYLQKLNPNLFKIYLELDRFILNSK